jgi:hypothetical protein
MSRHPGRLSCIPTCPKVPRRPESQLVTRLCRSIRSPFPIVVELLAVFISRPPQSSGCSVRESQIQVRETPSAFRPHNSQANRKFVSAKSQNQHSSRSAPQTFDLTRELPESCDLSNAAIERGGYRVTSSRRLPRPVRQTLWLFVPVQSVKLAPRTFDVLPRNVEHLP